MLTYLHGLRHEVTFRQFFDLGKGVPALLHGPLGFIACHHCRIDVLLGPQLFDAVQV